MKSIMSQNPCVVCTADRQVGNPYGWQTPCHNCEKKRAWDMEKSARVETIEEVLGDDYDLDRLRKLVEADRDGRCVVLPAGGHTEKDGENALKSAMNTCFYHNNPVTRYIADAVAEKLTREATDAALKGEQDG